MLTNAKRNVAANLRYAVCSTKTLALSDDSISTRWTSHKKKRCLSIFGFVHLARRVSRKVSKARCCRSPAYSWHGGRPAFDGTRHQIYGVTSQAPTYIWSYMQTYTHTHTHLCARPPQDPPFPTKEWLSKEDLNMLFCKMIPSYSKVCNVERSKQFFKTKWQDDGMDWYILLGLPSIPPVDSTMKLSDTFWLGTSACAGCMHLKFTNRHLPQKNHWFWKYI